MRLFMRKTSSSQGECWAEDWDSVMGHAKFFITDTEILIDDLRVKSWHRRKGVGTALVNHIRQIGLPIKPVCVLPNEDAHGFWDKVTPDWRTT